MSSNTRDALTLIAQHTPFSQEDQATEALALIAAVPDDPEAAAPAVEAAPEVDESQGSTPDGMGSITGTVSTPAS